MYNETSHYLEEAVDPRHLGRRFHGKISVQSQLSRGKQGGSLALVCRYIGMLGCRDGLMTTIKDGDFSSVYQVWIG